MSQVAIFYGSTIGDTRTGAELIAKELGGVEVFDVASIAASEVEKYDSIIFGSSTWGYGELQDDWVNFIEDLKGLTLKGKKVAIFGYGDQESYPDTFVDAIGIIYETVSETGAEVVGECSSDSYNFDSSKAVKDGKFVGLPLDTNNQEAMTEDRIKNWVEDLKSKF